MSYTNHHGLSRYIDDDNFTDDYDLINYNYDEYDGCITQQSETYIDGHANNDNVLKHVKRNIRRNRRKFLRACAYGSSDDIDRMAYSMRGQITIPWYLAFKTAVNTNTIEVITHIANKCQYYNFYCDMRPICNSITTDINNICEIFPLYDINITSIILSYAL